MSAARIAAMAAGRPRGLARKKHRIPKGHRARVRASGPARRKGRYRLVGLPAGRSSRYAKCHKGHSMKTSKSKSRARKERSS